jgi:hypothetical protein
MFSVGRCPPVPELANAVPSTNLALNGTVNVYQCVHGYVFPNKKSSLPMLCDGLTWNDTAVRCHSK